MCGKKKRGRCFQVKIVSRKTEPSHSPPHAASHIPVPDWSAGAWAGCYTLPAAHGLLQACSQVLLPGLFHRILRTSTLTPSTEDTFSCDVWMYNPVGCPGGMGPPAQGRRCLETRLLTRWSGCGTQTVTNACSYKAAKGTGSEQALSKW